MTKKTDHGRAIIDPDVMRQMGTSVPRTVAELHCLLGILASFGIVGGYEHLEHQEVVPEACIKQATMHFDLMAHHGDKWLFEAWLEPELRRLSSVRGGSVRFLLSDTVKPETRERCSELASTHAGLFQVRLFSGPAIFRAVIIDKTRLLLSHYGHEVIERDWGNTKGWKSPQLVIEGGKEKEWSLLIPFRSVFRAAWDTAKQLEPGIEVGTKNAVKREFHPTKE